MSGRILHLIIVLVFINHQYMELVIAAVIRFYSGYQSKFKSKKKIIRRKLAPTIVMGQNKKTKHDVRSRWRYVIDKKNFSNKSLPLIVQDA